MSDKLDKALESVEAEAKLKDAERLEKTVPEGWRRGAVWEGDRGEITTGLVDGPPTDSDWDDLLRSRGLDPDKFAIVNDSIKWSSWDGWKKDPDTGEAYSAICYSFKAEIRRKSGEGAIPEEIYKKVRAKKKGSESRSSGDSTLLVTLSDWQVGNRDQGGVEAQIEAIAELPEKIEHRLTSLRRAGYDIGTLCLAGLGDLVEGTCGHYPAQQYRIDLDRRDQVKVVRRGLIDIIDHVAPLVESLAILAVPGNHGENRKDGKAFTSVNDNDDTAVFEQVYDVFKRNENGAFDHVKWNIAQDEIVLSVELSGQIVSFYHGHTAKSSGGAINTLWNWWKDQSMGVAYPALRDSTILVAGHHHHTNIKEQEGRALFVAPSLTPVGEWWRDITGDVARTGTMSFVITPEGWREFSII